MANYLGNFLKKYPNALMIAAGEDSVSASYELGNVDFGDVRSTSILYFHDLRRREIIQYTDAQLANEANKAQIQEKILKLCKQMELPYNYWTISLFLLIHHKASDAYNKNLFAILDVCIDEIFDKKKILLENWRITYNQLKGLGAKLAMHLFVNHEDNIYSASKDDIVGFLNVEFDKNRRYAVEPIQVFNFFVSCGLLKLTSNGYYVFRLNGFFEYFLAYEMTQNQLFKETILSDERMYLAFKNQLEIYSGLKNNDSYFLKFVFDRTFQKCNPIFKDYSEDKDKELSEKIEIPNKLERESKDLSVKALTSLQKAEVEDGHEGGVALHSEVHLMESIDPTQNSIDVLSRYLSILSRVFKNIDQVDSSVIDPVFVFKSIINYYCDFSYFIIEELSQRTKICIEKNDFGNVDEEEAFKLLRFMSNFSPLIAQMEVYDGIGHFSIENMVFDEIKELSADASHNQYKLFILYFLLFDLSLERRDQLMDQALSYITMPLLRYMMNLKFNYYLAFRTDNNKSLQEMLSGKIRTVRKLLDNKVDSSSIEGGIADMKKDALVHKQMKG